MTRIAPLLAVVLLPLPAVSQDIEADAETIATFVASACVFTGTGDIATPLAKVQEAARATGLPVVVETETLGIYGDLAGLKLVTSTSAESIACAVEIPADQINHDGFELIEARVTAAFDLLHPGFASSEATNPSAEYDNRDWVINTADKDHIAAGLLFTEDGVKFSASATKIHE